MKQVILGTAGHIDHGKTSLIKAITGINTDRLKEEQQRGITIELGFASMDLPSGQHLGIVDVPGHEKFVKNMVAGATGIDIVAMVIAADEGVMPQTREHLEICALLGVRYGIVVLTKIDMVDEEWLELVIDDVTAFTQGTFLEGQPILPVSSATGQGIQAFVATLETISAQIPERPPSSIFRLPIDRVFTMKGFGTVITGTLVSGQVRVGDTIMIYPSTITSKVRGLQVHNQSVDQATPGLRTAINFQGLEKASVNRGEVLSTPGALKPSYMVDGEIHYLKSNKKPLKNRTRVRFHTGTSEIMGILILLDRDELLPGETVAAQIRLDQPVALVRDDRFVLRSYSPIRTIGGGPILNPIPPKHKRFKQETIDSLQALMEKAPEDTIALHIDSSGYHGVAFSDLILMTNLTEKRLENALQPLLSQQAVIQVDKDNRIYIHQNTFATLKTQMTGYLNQYHTDNPLRAGMPTEELKSKFPLAIGARLLNQIIQQMVKDKLVVQAEDTIRLSDHKVSLGLDQAAVKEKLLQTYAQSALQPPYFKEVVKTLDMDPQRTRDVLQLMVAEGQLVKAKEDLYFHAQALDGLKKRLVAFLSDHDEITTPQFKEMTGASRKFVIPLLEYFDAKNITIRIGDTRKLRKKV
ncbi:selenocysteine-specific translation elongation factor [Thermodesulfobacteriota bacterium]